MICRCSLRGYPAFPRFFTFRRFGTQPNASVDQLDAVSAALMIQVRQNIKKNALIWPTSHLCLLTDQALDDHTALFHRRLHRHFSESPDHFGDLADNVHLQDFLRPSLQKLPGLVAAAQLNQFPLSLALYKRQKSPSDVLAGVYADLFHQHVKEKELNKSSRHKKAQEHLWDLLAPEEWFPQARRMKRKLIMHVGPTNSGKTHNSLKALAKAKSGYYAGPLRLLAREIYERFQAQGIRCNLITGEEVVPSVDNFGNVTEILAGTIEMIPLNKPMDICIIDEIQMIADVNRGAAWTNALLGVQAKEVHLCGEESAVDLVTRLAQSVGDEVEVKRYERLGKLSVQEKPLRGINDLRKGDCVIVFSKRKILAKKCEIERKTNLRVGVIYGALPPEIRSLEAYKFNNGLVDVLVASDAVGMGLNLRINRIVFGEIRKFDGSDMLPLSVSATKQIAGRAGRFSASEGELHGYVTAFNNEALAFVRDTMKERTADLEKACLWPPREYWSYHLNDDAVDASLAKAVQSFKKIAGTKHLDNFFYMDFDRQQDLVDLFQRAKLHRKLTIEDQLTLMLIPINLSRAQPLEHRTCERFFEAILNSDAKSVFDFQYLHLSALRLPPSVGCTDQEILEVVSQLEIDHKLTLCFMWLSQRWPTVFVDRESAHEIKTLVEKRISEELVCLRRALKSQKKRKSSSSKSPSSKK